MVPRFLLTLNSRSIAERISSAKRRVILVAPGIHMEPAEALVKSWHQNSLSYVTVRVDFDETTLRMGYGTLEAVKLLIEYGVEVRHAPKVRTGILVVDDHGWIYTPNALYLEAEPDEEEVPNAVELTLTQVDALAIRLSEPARWEASDRADSPEEALAPSSAQSELIGERLNREKFAQVETAIKDAPPVKFDIARQVRVFEPYLQYVELSLTGAAVQRHRVQIPKELQNIGVSKEIEGKLKTTFDLIERSSSLSSKSLEDDLNQVRKNFTPSLGKDHGRVVLKSAKPHLEERISELKAKLAKHQETVAKELQAKLDESRDQIVRYYLPLVKASPPDSLRGSMLGSEVSDELAKKWVESQLSKIIPEAEKLIQKMTLVERFKDVTFETLNQEDFLESVKKAFPYVDWDRAYKEFKAAGQQKGEGESE